MAAHKSVPNVYVCKCEFEQTGHCLQFCGRCGSEFVKMNGEDVHYVNTCDCCEDITKVCKTCGSVPSPMSLTSFQEHRRDSIKIQQELKERYNNIKRRCDQLGNYGILFSDDEVKEEHGEIRRVGGMGVVYSRTDYNRQFWE